jgi:hypothetical protein
MSTTMARVNVYELNVYDDGTGTVTEWERDEATGGLIFRCRRSLDEGETRRAAYVLAYPYAPLPASLELPAPLTGADGGQGRFSARPLVPRFGFRGASVARRRRR